MNTFYRLLGSALIVSATNNFVWFALTYWVYLQTKSVVSTGFVGGIFLVITALSGFWFGSIVDHNKKKTAMILSSIATLTFFILSFIIYNVSPSSAFTSVSSPLLWIFALTLLCGSIAGNIYNIAIPTLVTILVPENVRDKANGLFGTIMGVSFAITSIASGLILGYGGMMTVLIVAISFTILGLIYLSFITIPEKKIIHTGTGKTSSKKIDIKGTIKAINAIPGLFALIFFTTFNNFVGGTFMALMDAYGLSLVSVQVWGLLWGFLSFGFIFGGMYIAKKGLGSSPLKTLFRTNIIIWITCIFFAIQPSIILLTIGMLIWMCLVPFIEATEQTIIQKVVPPERQGRVFGFSQSIEQAASPLTAFMIGPITQFVFIPFMTTGKGATLIGNWFGVGTGRGIALVFILAGILGLIVTLIAMRSQSYKLLSKRYNQPAHT
ncbi:MAG TPA: MFS transporter [Candidatus Nitrosocosmicus sp.]|nr:MFS transporter [Candidatus Nitrosocosmicus sp.]